MHPQDTSTNAPLAAAPCASPPARAEALRSQLVDIGDGLAGAFQTLSHRPSAPACEELAMRCHGAALHVMALQRALLDASKSNDQ